MAESEIISALNSLRVCLESKLIVTNQIVEEFKSSMDYHFASLQHNKFSHGFSSPPNSSYPHGYTPSPLPNPFPNSSPTANYFRLCGERKAKEGDDLVYSNAALEVVEYDAWLEYVEIKVIENAVVDNIKVVVDSKLDTKLVEVTTCEFSCKITTIEEEKLKTPDAYFADDALMLDITPTHSMLANEEKENKRISEVADLPLIIQEFGEGINCVVKQLGMVRQYKAHIIISSIMARRRTIFKLYGLKEVYVDYLNLHLEDKVILKGQRVDTIKKRDNKY